MTDFSKLPIGTRVKHPEFGEGVIININFWGRTTIYEYPILVEFKTFNHSFTFDGRLNIVDPITLELLDTSSEIPTKLSLYYMLQVLYKELEFLGPDETQYKFKQCIDKAFDLEQPSEIPTELKGVMMEVRRHQTSKPIKAKVFHKDIHDYYWAESEPGIINCFKYASPLPTKTKISQEALDKIVQELKDKYEII